MPDISTGNIVQGKTDQVSGCHKNTTLPVYNPGRTGTGWHKGCSLQSPRHYSDATITHVVGIIGGNGDVFSKPGSSSSREMAYGIVSRKVWTAASQQSLADRWCRQARTGYSCFRHSPDCSFPPHGHHLDTDRGDQQGAGSFLVLANWASGQAFSYAQIPDHACLGTGEIAGNTG